MMDYYIETLPDEIAKTIVGHAYKKHCYYQLVQDTSGSYIIARDKETDERVGDDDIALDVEDFDFTMDELEEYKEDTSADYTKHGLGLMPIFVVASSVVMFISVVVVIILALYLGG